MEVKVFCRLCFPLHEIRQLTAFGAEGFSLRLGTGVKGSMAKARTCVISCEQSMVKRVETRTLTRITIL